MSNMPNKKANGDLAAKSNASASATDLSSKKDHAEDTVTCKICQQSLPAIEFSNSELKKLNKTKVKGNPM